MVAGGAGTASVTVEPFAAIAPGYTTVFANKRADRRRSPQDARGLSSHLADITNASGGRAAVQLCPVDAAQSRGESQGIGVNRVTFDAATHVVRIFPGTRLEREHRPTGSSSRGQPVGPVTCSSTGENHLGNGVIVRHEEAGSAVGPARGRAGIPAGGSRSPGRAPASHREAGVARAGHSRRPPCAAASRRSPAGLPSASTAGETCEPRPGPRNRRAIARHDDSRLPDASRRPPTSAASGPAPESHRRLRDRATPHDNRMPLT